MRHRQVASLALLVSLPMFLPRVHDECKQDCRYNEETALLVSKEIVEFAASAACEGLSKSVRKTMLKDTPVPFHKRNDF